MADNPTDKPDQASAIDPDAIDLDAIKDLRYWRDSRFVDVISDLIASGPQLRGVRGWK
ncbi:hypothetical protein LCGC14_2826890 [marine sediment metagenome]|uniref:Uncharacterized protein n=1 Tax=marine sediment metagenome TaxID=412755 RepID=A0A0F8YF91_9ZZZZ